MQPERTLCCLAHNVEQTNPRKVIHKRGSLFGQTIMKLYPASCGAISTACALIFSLCGPTPTRAQPYPAPSDHVELSETVSTCYTMSSTQPRNVRCPDELASPARTLVPQCATVDNKIGPRWLRLGLG